MARIIINKDGSFESLSADIPARIEKLKVGIAKKKAELKAAKAILPALKKIQDLIGRIQGSPTAVVQERRAKAAALREKYNIGAGVRYAPTFSKIGKLTDSIVADTEKLAELKAASKGARSKVKMDVDRNAGKKVIKNNAKVDKLSAPSKKPSASLNKKENVNAEAITNVVAKMDALKKDISKCKVPSKAQHMERDLAALRSHLALLKKGQSAKNRAHMLPNGEVNMRNLRAVHANKGKINRLERTLKELRPGSREHSRVRNQIRNLSGLPPVK